MARKRYFTTGELLLWGLSVLAIIVSFLIFDRDSWVTLAASIIGVTSFDIQCKGQSARTAVIIIFSVFYGYISYTFRYYGEMITYLGMSAPMAVFALVSWLRNPY